MRGINEIFEADLYRGVVADEDIQQRAVGILERAYPEMPPEECETLADAFVALAYEACHPALVLRCMGTAASFQAEKALKQNKAEERKDWAARAERLTVMADGVLEMEDIVLSAMVKEPTIDKKAN